MADDLGWGDVGFNGNHYIMTPALDDMAKNGVQFNRFHSASAVCSPMRGSALTGRHPERYGGKKNDFWEFAELLQHYSVANFIRFHQEKYLQQNLLISVPQAMMYFGDAEECEDPVSLKGQTWKN